MDFKEFGNFNWIEMDSKDQNLDLNQQNESISVHFQSIFICWVVNQIKNKRESKKIYYSNKFSRYVAGYMVCIITLKIYLKK